MPIQPTRRNDRRRASAAALLLALLLAPAAQAHDNAYLDTLTAPHGGQLRMTGAFHLEMVVTPTALQVYVTDHAGTATAVANGSASAVVLNGKIRTSVDLTPKDGNLLEGSGSFDPALPTKAVITLHLPGQDPRQARFDTATLHPATPASQP